MTDAEAIRRAVLAAPDADLPRLVYADWLDEYGPELPGPDGETAADRAAVIRAQVESARHDPFSPAARAAGEQAAGLLGRHHHTWTRHLGMLGDRAEFTRGFVGLVEVEAGRFADAAGAAFAAEPVHAVRVRRARSADPWEPLDAVFDCPHLRRVTTLEIPAATMLYLEYVALAASPHLAGLRTLSLHGNPVPPQWLTDFIAGPQLPALTGLDLSDIPNLGPAVAAGLARAGDRRFTRLDLSGVYFRSGDLQQVLASRCLEGVEELRLGWGGPADGPLTFLNLGWVMPWGRLRALDISGHGVGPEGVREVVRAAEAAGLRALGLAANGLGAEGAALLAAPSALDLYHLDVRRNDLRPPAVAALRHRFPDAVVLA